MALEFTGTETRNLLRRDEVKILTGNSPEMYLDNTNYSFDQVFGLDRAMKTVMSLVGDKFKGETYWLFDEGTYYSYEDDPRGQNRLRKDDLFFEMAALRNKQKKRQSRSFK